MSYKASERKRMDERMTDGLMDRCRRLKRAGITDSMQIKGQLGRSTQNWVSRVHSLFKSGVFMRHILHLNLSIIHPARAGLTFDQLVSSVNRCLKGSH
jgi:hypothetical protein